MEFIDALQKNVETLVASATKLSGRIDVLRSSGLSAIGSIDELIRTCDEIGRLNDRIRRELDRQREREN